MSRKNYIYTSRFVDFVTKVFFLLKSSIFTERL